MLDISIVILNYNTFQITCKCIESIYTFTNGVNFEIILVDNASTECSPDLFLEKFPDIQIVKNSENLGFAKGNNTGISKTSAPFILLLNSDTELVDNALLSAVELLKAKKHENVKVVSGKLVFPNGNIQHQCGRFPSITLTLLEIFRIQKLMSKRQRENLMMGGFFDHQRPIYPDWVWGTFFLFDRDILNIFAEQKLPETFFMYQEDLEWCFYIRKAGYRIYYDPRIVIIHLFSGSSTSKIQNQRKHINLVQNFNYFLKEHYGRVYFAVYTALRKVNQALQR